MSSPLERDDGGPSSPGTYLVSDEENTWFEFRIDDVGDIHMLVSGFTADDPDVMVLAARFNTSVIGGSVHMGEVHRAFRRLVETMQHSTEKRINAEAFQRLRARNQALRAKRTQS